MSGEDCYPQWFLAVDAATGTLLLSLEAASVDQATARFVQVAPLVGIDVPSLAQGILCVGVTQPFEGCPVFRDTYFMTVDELTMQVQNAPSSMTVQ